MKQKADIWQLKMTFPVPDKSPDKLPEELHQRHWYDSRTCKKRTKAKMWWLEHGQQGCILSKNEERRLYGTGR